MMTQQRKIVVGVDGSPGSRAALRWALGLAATQDVQVVAVEVQRRVSAFLPATSMALLPHGTVPVATTEARARRLHSVRRRDLTSRQRRGVLAAATVQIGLALGAWYDLFHRPKDMVNGPKPLWAVLIAVNFVGPIVYFRFGRRRPVARKATAWHERTHLDTSDLTR